MNPIVFAKRRPVTTLLLVLALVCGGILGLYKMRVDIPRLHTSKLYAFLDDVNVRAKPLKTYVAHQYEALFHKHEEEAHHEQRKVVVTSPEAKAVVIPQQYVCQIHSQRHINVLRVGRRISGEYLGQRGASGKEGRIDVQNRSHSLRGKAGRRVCQGSARATEIQ